MSRPILRMIERCLLVAGFACLMVYGAARLDARASQSRATRDLAAATQLVAENRASSRVRSAVAALPDLPACPSDVERADVRLAGSAWPAGVPDVPAPNMTSWDPGRRECHARAVSKVDPASALAHMDIPSIKLSVMVLPGVDALCLNGGVGHIPGTPPPGEPGNVGIAGHRDGFFRGLENIAAGEIIRLTTPQGAFEYRVQWTRIVEPRDVSVLQRTGDDALTLVTCYPFRILGSAPRRFIVRASCAGILPDRPSGMEVQAAGSASRIDPPAAPDVQPAGPALD